MTDWLTPDERERMEHSIHRHLKRDEVFDRASELGTIHEDTRRIAKLLDHADEADRRIKALEAGVSKRHAAMTRMAAVIEREVDRVLERDDVIRELADALTEEAGAPCDTDASCAHLSCQALARVDALMGGER